MYDEISPEGSASEAKKAKARGYAAKKAMKLSTGEIFPKEPKPMGRPKSVVNRVTEYGALFNKMNEDQLSKGLPPLMTAMEVLIHAMQSPHLDIKDKARIADKLAPFESSRAPIISIEHVQNINREEEVDATESLDDFLQSLRKV